MSPTPGPQRVLNSCSSALCAAQKTTLQMGRLRIQSGHRGFLDQQSSGNVCPVGRPNGEQLLSQVGFGRTRSYCPQFCSLKWGILTLLPWAKITSSDLSSPPPSGMGKRGTYFPSRKPRGLRVEMTQAGWGHQQWPHPPKHRGEGHSVQVRVTHLAGKYQAKAS